MCIWCKKETSAPWQPGAAWYHRQLSCGVVISCLCTHSVLWCSLAKQKQFHRTLMSDKAILWQGQIKTKPRPVSMSEHRQNMNIVQATKMTKHSSVLANTSDYCFLLPSFSFAIFSFKKPDCLSCTAFHTSYSIKSDRCFTSYSSSLDRGCPPLR